MCNSSFGLLCFVLYLSFIGVKKMGHPALAAAEYRVGGGGGKGEGGLKKGPKSESNSGPKSWDQQFGIEGEEGFSDTHPPTHFSWDTHPLTHP